MDSKPPATGWGVTAFSLGIFLLLILFLYQETVFMLADPGSPTLIRDSVESGAIYVLMPMRV